MNIRIALSRAQSTWDPPEGLDRSWPREVCLTGGGKAAVVLAVVMVALGVAAGVGMGLTASREAREARLLETEGVVTDGVITRLWRSSGKDRQPWVAYRFVVGDKGYEANARVSLGRWRNLRVGSAVPVRYVPTQPELSYPFNTPRSPLPFWLPFPVALALVAGGLLTTLPIHTQRKLLSEGRSAQGHVTQHGPLRHSARGGNFGRVFYYQFPLLSGAVAKGHSSPVRNPPAVGSTICVLYDPENPRRNAPYPFTHVTLVQKSWG